MKTTLSHFQTLRTPASEPSSRAGVAMIIVLSLMGALAFLGFFFFSYTLSELDSANWFFFKSNDPTSRTDMNPQLSSSQDPNDIYFDWAMESVLVGTRAEYTNSALYGNKFSLMASMLGQINGDLSVTDLHPFNGAGVHVLIRDMDGDGIPDDETFNLDYDGNGTGETHFVLNRSVGAHTANTDLNYSGLPLPGYQPFGTSGPNDRWFPYSQMKPDVDYTYPDINNLFLAHFSWVPNSASATGFSPVFIPSFHRPQYLSRAIGSTAGPWNAGGSLPAHVLRPHEGQRPSYWNGSAAVADAASARFNTTNFNFSQPTEGIWKTGNVATFDPSTYNYDMDADGDGVKEAIYLDLDFPPTPWIDTLNADGASGYGRKFFIPMFGVTILDADGLINLNASGNLNHIIDDVANYYTPGTNTPRSIAADVALDGGFGTPGVGDLGHFFSASNQGYSPFEINVSRALYASTTMHDPGINGKILESILAPYTGMFGDDLVGTPALRSQLKMANYDLFRMINGATRDYNNTGSIVSAIPIAGRHGDERFLVPDLYGTRSDLSTQWTAFTDANVARSWLFSRPGTGRLGTNETDFVGFDDDSDGTILAANAGGGMPRSNITVPYPGGNAILDYPASVHPVDVLGTGDILDYEYTGAGNFGAARRLFFDNDPLTGRLQYITLNPSAWPYYKGNWQTLGTGPFAGVTPYSAIDVDQDAIPADLIENSSSVLFNEADELILEPDFADQIHDKIFSASEMEALHLSDSDYARVALGKESRLRELMPFNLRDHSDSRFIRKQFTTSSWERREFSVPRLTDTTVAGGFDRSWEYNDNLSAAGVSPNPIFPPIFGQPTPTIPYTDEDPIRPALRKLLTNIPDYNGSMPSTQLLQRKMQLGYLVDDRNTALDYDISTLTPSPQNVSPYFRPLTPHPVLTAPIGVLPPMEHDNSFVPSTSPDDGPAEQEWWARYDRQRLARDIYVLLYTFGAPDDLDPTTFAYGTDLGAIDLNGNGIDDRVERMAQFAVNVVDAMDPDHHITRFAYDPNLSDGWDTDETNLQVVYGVEEQRLVFSEGMWLNAQRSTQPAYTADAPLTLHQEYDSGNEVQHQYLFLELRNASALSVPLNGHSYRLVRISHDNGSGDLSDANTQQITFENLPQYPFGLQAGQNFLIGTHSGDLLADNGQSHDSVLRCRLDWNGNGALDPAGVDNDDAYRPIIPAFQEAIADQVLSNAAPVANTKLDLDLCHLSHRNTSAPYHNYYVEEETRPLGYFLRTADGTAVIDAAQNIRVSLQRRLNVDAGASLDDNDNPWIEVDRIELPASRFELPPPARDNTLVARQELYLATAGSSTGVLTGPTLASTVRVDRFGGYVKFDDASHTPRNRLYQHSMGEHFPEGLATATPHHPNLLTFSPRGPMPTTIRGQWDSHNFNSQQMFYTWHPHFDRPPTSVIELFSVPIAGGTRLLTSQQLSSGNIAFTPKSIAPGVDPTANVYSKMSDTHMAGFWFLNPQGADLDEDNDSDPTTPTPYDAQRNRWYRALEFFEIEPQVHKSIAGLIQTPRRPGKINLNTIRATQPPTTVGGVINPQAGYLSALAALIDDPVHLNLFPSTQLNPAPAASPSIFNLNDDLEAGRDWGNQFLVARDGLDFNTGLPLPGGIGSRPFRSLSYLDTSPVAGNADRSIQQTILRDMPYGNAYSSLFNPLTDNTEIDAQRRRQLFEARTAADSDPDAPEDNVDYHTRHRLLAKIDNNSTTTSNVFYIFVGVEFFEATETTTNSGFWQVGRKLTSADDPQFKMRRGFFVVDRSLLEKAYDPVTKRIDFRKLILHRRKLAPYN